MVYLEHPERKEILVQLAHLVLRVSPVFREQTELKVLFVFLFYNR
jgi:hypothetical protein